MEDGRWKIGANIAVGRWQLRTGDGRWSPQELGYSGNLVAGLGQKEKELLE
jgi:hypothetical protein